MKTNINTKTRTWQILTVMKILAWVAVFGFLVEGGAILISYVVSLINPDAAKNLYKGLNLHSLREYNFWHYTLSVTFLIVLSILKSSVWYQVTRILSQINLLNPFTIEVALKLERISYLLFATWLVGIASSVHTVWLMEKTSEVHGTYTSGEFIFMAGLVFIISQVFKRGVEIQSENELTV